MIEVQLPPDNSPSGILVQVEGHDDKRHVFTGPFTIGSGPYSHVQLDEFGIESLAMTVTRSEEGEWMAVPHGKIARRIPQRRIEKGTAVWVGLTTLIMVPF